jgi:hypothetical protein
LGHVEELAELYKCHIAPPWQRNLAGDQKVIMVVYPKEDERRLRARLGLFEEATTGAGHGWHHVDLTECFASWMSQTEYRDAYFEEPKSLEMKLRSAFVRYVADTILEALSADGVDEDAVVAVQGVGTLYGFARVSLVLKEVVKSIKGRLLVFFPGEYESNNYRLLDARDGWNYLAVAITLQDGGSK